MYLPIKMLRYSCE